MFASILSRDGHKPKKGDSVQGPWRPINQTPNHSKMASRGSNWSSKFRMQQNGGDLLGGDFPSPFLPAMAHCSQEKRGISLEEASLHSFTWQWQATARRKGEFPGKRLLPLSWVHQATTSRSGGGLPGKGLPFFLSPAHREPWPGKAGELARKGLYLTFWFCSLLIGGRGWAKAEG